MPPVHYLLQMKHIITHNRTPAVRWLGYGLDDREIVVRLPTGEREFCVLHNTWGHEAYSISYLLTYSMEQGPS